MRLAALREAARHEQKKVSREQQRLLASEARLRGEEARVEHAVQADRRSLQTHLRPSEDAVGGATNKYSAEQMRVSADLASARELRAAVKYEHEQQTLDRRAAVRKGRAALDEAAMMVKLQKLSKAEARTAKALEPLYGARSARLVALVTKVRHDSAIAYEQQRQATQLRKKGQVKLAHTLEHIAFEKTEQVNRQLETLHSLNKSIGVLRAAIGSNTSAAARDARDALEMQFWSKISAQEALMSNHDERLLSQKISNSSTLAAVLERQAGWEESIAQAQKKLIGVKVAQWMLKRVSFKKKLAPKKNAGSALSVERATIKKLRAKDAKDSKLASQLAALADGAAKQLKTATTNEAHATLRAKHVTELVHSGTDLGSPPGNSPDLMTHAVHQAVLASGKTQRVTGAWHGVEPGTDYSHGW